MRKKKYRVKVVQEFEVEAYGVSETYSEIRFLDEHGEDEYLFRKQDVEKYWEES